MDNENLILMLNALRLEIRHLTLQRITANAISQGNVPGNLIEDAKNDSTALRERADRAANKALRRNPR